MIKKIMSGILPSNEAFEKLLLETKFDEQLAFKMLKSDKVDINFINSIGDSFLTTSIKNNKYRASKWLVENGCELDTIDSDGLTPVRRAVQDSDNGLLKTILRKQTIDLDAKDHLGRTILQDAVLYGNNDGYDILMAYKADIHNLDNNNRNIVFDSVFSGDEKIIDKTLNLPNLDLNVVDNNGKTILHDNAVLNDDKLAKKLLDKGADPTICDKEGNNFLTNTALKGEAGIAMLEIAIQNGCDINRKLASKKSILMEVMFAFSKISSKEKARRDGLKAVAQTLLKHGLDPDAIDDKKENVLFELVRAGDLEGCAFVLENKANPNQQNIYGYTPLYCAILGGVKNIDLVILLLKYFADPTLKDNNNKCVVEILNDIIMHVHGVKTIENNEIFNKIDPTGNYLVILKEILHTQKGEFNYLNSKGNPLFFDAVLYEYLELAKIYIKAKVNINMKNNNQHNIFYEYILQVFNQQEYNKNFRDIITFLLLNNADRDCVNVEGQNIYTKLATLKSPNLQLFKHLIDVTKHNYRAQDKLGRTIMHYCVFNNNLKLLEIIYGVEKGIEKIDDNYNIVPMTYAALFGLEEIISFFIHKNAIVTSGKKIPNGYKAKLKPHLPKIKKLIDKCSDPDLKAKILILENQLIKDLS